MIDMENEMNDFDLKIFKMYPDVNLPKYGTAGAACFDIEAYIKGPYHQITEKIKVYRQSNINIPVDIGPNYDVPPEQRIATELYLWPGDRALVPTGIKVKLPFGFSLRVHPRSGAAIKKGICLANCEGIIDCDYYHEVFVPVINVSQSLITITHGERIAQGEVVADTRFKIVEIAEEPQQTTNRQGGFGSTGV